MVCLTITVSYGYHTSDAMCRVIQSYVAFVICVCKKFFCLHINERFNRQAVEAVIFPIFLDTL